MNIRTLPTQSVDRKPYTVYRINNRLFVTDELGSAVYLPHVITANDEDLLDFLLNEEFK